MCAVTPSITESRENSLDKVKKSKYNRVVRRGVAQFGSAPGLGPGGRRFESCRPDHVRASFISLALIFYVTIRVRSCRCSPFFAKRHARLACSVVNALTTAHNRYQLFTILRTFGTLRRLDFIIGKIVRLLTIFYYDKIINGSFYGSTFPKSARFHGPLSITFSGWLLILSCLRKTGFVSGQALGKSFGFPEGFGISQAFL